MNLIVFDTHLPIENRNEQITGRSFVSKNIIFKQHIRLD